MHVYSKKSKKYLLFHLMLIVNTCICAQQIDQHTLFMERIQADAELGYAIGAEYDYRTDFLKLNFTARYNLNPILSLGLGSGIRFYHDEKDAVIPLYACFQAFLPGNKVRPYFSLSFGYLLDITMDFTIYDVVPMFNPAAGIGFNVSKKMAINIGIGYEMQKSEIFNDWLGPSYPEYLSFVSLNFGLVFRELGFMLRGKKPGE